jgi:hypothetical protein
VYGPFGKTSEGFLKYYLKLDGYFYCKRKKSIILLIRIRNKRIIDKVWISKIINDKNYLMELHPYDVCIIGILANIEREGILIKDTRWAKKICLKEHECIVKSPPILEIIKKYTNKLGNETITLYSKFLRKKIEIPITELCQNQSLIYALDNFQALSLGYDIGELLIRNAIY